MAKNKFLGKQVMVRTDRAGVHFGLLKSKKKSEVLLEDARRVYYWSGAATLSELATLGTSAPNDCKFPGPVKEHLLLGVIEIIPLTKKAIKSLNRVSIWSES